MPPDAEKRALGKRGAWVERHLLKITQTFSNVVVSAAEIDALLRSIESDHSLVHAAYYTDDECIGRIADWIVGKE